MTYKGYESKVELDEKAGVFHGEVINTRDVITFQGSSIKELKQAFKDSVDDYLEFCASRGDDAEKPFSGKFLDSRAARSASANHDGGPAAGEEPECLCPGEAADGAETSSGRDNLTSRQGHRSVVRYLRPESDATMTAVPPRNSPSRSCRAATRLAPVEKPANTPSTRANSRAALMASLSLTAT